MFLLFQHARYLFFSYKIVVHNMNSEIAIRREQFFVFFRLYSSSDCLFVCSRVRLKTLGCGTLLVGRDVGWRAYALLNAERESKGRLILKCPFSVFKSPRRIIFFAGFLLWPLKRGQINKGHSIPLINFILTLLHYLFKITSF